MHEHKRLGRGIELAALAEQLRAAGIGLEFLTGELQGSHDPSGVVFTVLAAMSGMEREYIRDRTLEGHESARARGKSIGGAAVTDEAMLAVALHLRGQERSLRDIAARLVIATGKKKGQHPSPATVMRMLREHDEKTAECFTTTTGWTLHQLRHTRIRELKDDNCPLPVLQKITGHRSLRTLTEHYPGPSPETVRAWYENTDPDARRRRGSRALALPPTVFPALRDGWGSQPRVMLPRHKDSFGWRPLVRGGRG